MKKPGMPMTLLDFKPTNSLEIKIADTKNNASSVDPLMLELAHSSLFVSSKNEVQANGDGFEPLLLEGTGGRLVAAFSSVERPVVHRAKAAFILQMPGRDFFLRLPPDYGVIINPGYVVQFIMNTDAITRLKTILRLEPPTRSSD